MALRDLCKVLRYRDSPTYVWYSNGKTGEVGEYVVSRRQQALHNLFRRRQRTPHA
jgi:hypothetical protein